MGHDLETKQHTVRKEGREGGRQGEADRKEGTFPLSRLLGEVAPAPALRTQACRTLQQVGRGGPGLVLQTVGSRLPLKAGLWPPAGKKNASFLV